MTEIATRAERHSVGAYRDRFELLQKENFFPAADWMRQQRQAAISRFVELGFPTTRWEQWRHTNVAPLVATEFAQPMESQVALDAIAPLLLDGHPYLVFVGGSLSQELSSNDDLPSGVTLTGLEGAFDLAPGLLEEHLGRYALWDDQPFAALNTAFWTDIAVIHVAPNVILDRPIRVIHWATADGRPVMTSPRTLIIAETGSRVVVLEQFVNLEEGSSWFNAVTEIVAGPNAVVECVQVRQGGPGTFQTTFTAVHQAADSRVRLHSLTTGGRLTRVDISANLAEPGAELILGGLYLVRGREHVDHHTRIDHVAPHCTSRENYKGILDDEGQSVFNGLVVVHPDAQQTDAMQSNRNLMLSDNALVHTNPQLEIYANDVRCTHGSTVGQLEEEALFYLRTRGLAVPEAQRLLIDGFAEEVLALVNNPALRDSLERTVQAWITARELARD
ncbi:MAG: Fe-S cluster assembly protein SufD [Candidatus Marinimicrobia bacterium]|nr:Fe-S cluster assembly protein SufD [Candidatus Neomarinimicrobiota bacterium]